MKKKLLIITEIIAPYRIPVFNALACIPEIDLHVIFLARTDPALRQWEVYDDEIHFSWEVLQSYRRRSHGINLLLNRGLSAALRRALPDTIVCGGYNYFASWQALSWAHRHRVPFVLWIESTAKDSRRNNVVIEFLKKRFLAGCTGFVVPGKASRQYLLGFKIPENKIFLAPNAVDNDFFRKAADGVQAEAVEWRKKLKLPPRYFLFVGRIVREKGVFDLLSAYGKLGLKLRSEVGLLFVGDGPCRAELEHTARELRTVQFRGFIQRDDLAPYYSLAEAFIFPTHSDPWGLVVNEAMACGLPIVCSDVAGCVDDLIDNGWNGYIVPAGNIESLAAALGEMAGNANRLTMGQNSRLLISNYPPQLCAEGIASSALIESSI